jgi:hypothetical protein
LCFYLRRFLESNGIQVDFYDGVLYTLREHQRQRRDPSIGEVPVLKRVVKNIARQLNERKYPVIIATEREDIFLEDLPNSSRRFYYCTAPISYERYYGWLFRNEPDLDNRLESALELERSIYQSVDVITFAWNTYEDFARINVYNGSNIITHPGLGWFGCEPQQQRVDYKDNLALVSLGLVEYWSNPSLLIELTRQSPFPIHLFGKTSVPLPGVEHFGYVEDEWELLNKYHLGLNTVSMDPLRRAGFSSKVLTCLSAGMPVFSPDWQTFSHQVAGVVPFNTDNFVELVERHHGPLLWQKLSDQAYDQAQELRWDKILAPYLDLLRG